MVSSNLSQCHATAHSSTIASDSSLVGQVSASLDDLITVPVHGDCLAVERMADAMMARTADLTSLDRLEGAEPVPQEFHHRGLMLQAS